jgi:hypothetical protein
MPTQNRINAAIPLSVSNSGTGVSSTTAYGVLCSGTSSTNPIQNAGTGTTGQVLTSNGTSLPSFQDNYDYILIKTTTLSNGDASVIFDNLSSTYRVYYVLVDALCNTNNIWHYSQVSDDNGATWKATNYTSGNAYLTAVPGTTWSAVQSSTTFMYVAGLTFTSANAVTWITYYNIGTSKPVAENYQQFSGYYIPACGSYNATSNINAIKIYPQSGTFNSGTVRLYAQK